MSQFSDKERKELKKLIEKFYQDVLDPYKEFERTVMRESRLSTMFKRVDYAGRLKELDKIKKINNSIKPDKITISDEDKDGRSLSTTLAAAQKVLNEVIDRQADFNELLYKKSKGEKAGFLESKKAHKAIKEAILQSREPLKTLDVDFSLMFY